MEEHKLVRAEQQWAITGQPVAAELVEGVESARQEIQRRDTAELVRRLDAVQVSHGRDLGRDVGIGL